MFVKKFESNLPLALICKALAAIIIVANGVLYAPGGSAQTSLPTLGDSSDLTTSEERRLIESATLLGHDDEAAFHLQRYRAAYPKDHARWAERQASAAVPVLPALPASGASAQR